MLRALEDRVVRRDMLRRFGWRSGVVVDLRNWIASTAILWQYVERTVLVMLYMKEESLDLNEVMYTSLMGAANMLANVEKERMGRLVLLDFGNGGGLGEFFGDENDIGYDEL